MNRALCIAFVLLAVVGRADTAAVLVLERGPLSESQGRKLLRTLEGTLREASGLTVQAAAAAPKAPKRCDRDLSCVDAQARAAGADFVLLAVLSGSERHLTLEGLWVDRLGRRSTRYTKETSLDELDGAGKALAEGAVPPWARRGWGALVLSAPADSTLKIDGRKVNANLKDPVAVTASTHAVDLLTPDGQAVLQRLHVPEGERLRLEPSSREVVFAADPAGRTESDELLRTTSYALWTAGALAVGGAFLAGAAARREVAAASPCLGSDRSCMTYEQAQSRYDQAQAYALGGNVLLGTGAALCAAGVGVFTFDLVRAGKSR